MKINAEVKKDDYPQRENKLFKRVAKVLVWKAIIGWLLAIAFLLIALILSEFK